MSPTPKNDVKIEKTNTNTNTIQIQNIRNTTLC